MKKLLALSLLLGLMVVSACAYHGKQEKDETYYKRTQSVGWPDSKK